LWLDDGTAPMLGVTWKRPGDTTAVLPTDADVIETLDVSGAEAFYIQSRGFAIANPAAGAWEVTVTGTSVPAEGQPYLVMATPDSQVGLSLSVEQPDLVEGGSQVITASLFDGATSVPASFGGTAILLDASEQALAFSDDGVPPDAVAGDHVYTASFLPPALCGGYRVKASATAATSEGTVTREQFLTFDVHVPDDAVRDPCKPDEDEDGLLDNAEIDVHGTNPIAPDTDGDGLTDGDEVNVTGTDPLESDTDGDGINDAAEDTDGDGCTDGQELGANEILGGRRDPLDFWDFYDVAGGIPSGPDGLIDFGDTLFILEHFGHGPDDDEFDDLIDRWQPDPSQPWRMAEADDGIDFGESLASLASFGHSCV
jgi:hypothetical protein